MEEMMMVMMKISGHEASPNIHHPSIKNTSTNLINIPTISPAWKLYENPFYTSHCKPHLLLDQQQECDHNQPKQIHRLQLPISARKIAASFWDLTFIKPFMESELEMARVEISELKAELECERKARRKMESLSKRLAREVSEEKKGREAMERVCEELGKELSAVKAEIRKMKREMDEERKMLRTAEVIREERVQMKLADAKILLEEKLLELQISNKIATTVQSSSSSSNAKITNQTSFGDKLRFVLGERNSMALVKRKAGCVEAENPHIKRGIKGFVEFPKVVRAIGCRSSKHLGSKLECQKAQLKILLKQKGPAVRFNGLINAT